MYTCPQCHEVFRSEHAMVKHEGTASHTAVAHGTKKARLREGHRIAVPAHALLSSGSQNTGVVIESTAASSWALHNAVLRSKINTPNRLGVKKTRQARPSLLQRLAPGGESVAPVDGAPRTAATNNDNDDIFGYLGANDTNVLFTALSGGGGDPSPLNQSFPPDASYLGYVHDDGQLTSGLFGDAQTSYSDDPNVMQYDFSSFSEHTWSISNQSLDANF